MVKIACSGCSLQRKGLDTTLDLISRAGYDAIELSGLSGDITGDEEQRKNILAQIEEADLFIEALRWRGPDGVKMAVDFRVPLLATGIRAKESDKETFESDVKSFKDVYMGADEVPHKRYEWIGPASGVILIMNYVLDGGVLASHHHGIVRGGYAKFSTENIGTEGVMTPRHPLSKSRLAIRSNKLPESKREWYFPEITEPTKGTGDKTGGIPHHKLFIDDILNDT